MFYPKNTIAIRTSTGSIMVNVGDYIVQEVGGGVYPCNPDIFEKTYEEVKQ